MPGFALDHPCPTEVERHAASRPGRAPVLSVLGATAGMHIAFFLSDLGGGGAQRRVLALSGAMATEGHRVDLVVASGEGVFRDQVSPDVRICSVEGGLARLPLIGARRGLRVAVAVRGLAGYLADSPPDVLVSSSSPANIAALRARGLCGYPALPVVITVNVDPGASLAGRSRIHGALLRMMLRRYYPRAAAVVVNAQSLAAGVSSIAQVPVGRIVAIPNPVDCQAIRRQAAAPLAHPWLGPAALPLVLAVGKLKPQKDFEALIRAFARLRAARPANLLILGEGDQRPRLTALVRELGLEGSVALPGFVSNPYAWMSRAAVFVLSSRWEGFSNVLAEALAVGCPVVSTDCPGGTAELLEGGVFGPLVPVGDHAALARAIEAVLDNPAPAARLRAHAETFSVARATRRYLAVFRNVAGAARVLPLPMRSTG